MIPRPARFFAEALVLLVVLVVIGLAAGHGLIVLTKMYIRLAR
jgi:hypothetical protein